MRLQVNLVQDWIEYLQDQLVEAGFKIPIETKNEDISFWYFNYIRRLVNPRPRNVLFSQEFNCPPELKSGLDNVIQKIKDGKDIAPHLSKQIKNLKYDDDLLNDWGIYHIHLGTKMDNSNFIERTGALLFARFDELNAYCINVMPHGSWSKQDMVKCVHQNWPESVSRYLLKGISDLEYTPSDKDIKTLRKGHITTMVKIADGIIYAPLGGGFMTSGISTEVVRISDYYMQRMWEFEKILKERTEDIVRALAGKEDVPIRLHLEISNGDCYAVEKQEQLVIKLGKLHP